MEEKYAESVPDSANRVGAAEALINAETSSDFPPPLWSQMAPASRQQLSQMIAELIRRTQLPSHAKEALNEKAA